MAGAHPDATAWLNLADGCELTFGDWDAQSNRLARGSDRHGLGLRGPGGHRHRSGPTVPVAHRLRRRPPGRCRGGSGQHQAGRTGARGHPRPRRPRWSWPVRPPRAASPGPSWRPTWQASGWWPPPTPARSHSDLGVLFDPDPSDAHRHGAELDGSIGGRWTSCTPRGRPGRPRQSSSGTDPAADRPGPALERAGIHDRLPLLDDQWCPARLRTDERRPQRLVPAPFRPRCLAGHRSRTAVRWSAFIVPAMAQLIVAHPALRRGRPLQPGRGDHRGSPHRPGHPAAARRAAARDRHPGRLRPDRIRSGDPLAVR